MPVWQCVSNTHTNDELIYDEWMNPNLSAIQMKEDCPVLKPRDLHQSMVSCVVPAYNEHDNLGLLLPRLQAVLTQTGADWAIIVVDDGSRDATATLMMAWTQNPGFRYVQLSRNFGKEAAITAGIEAAVGDAVLILDADLQHPPELLSKMLSRWQAGIDMIYAVRENRYDESFAKRLGTKFFYSLLKSSSGVVVPPNAGDFRLMDRKVVDALLRLPERNPFMKGMYAWVGFNTPAHPLRRWAIVFRTCALRVSLLRPIRITRLLDGRLWRKAPLASRSGMWLRPGSRPRKWCHRLSSTPQDL